MTFSFYLMLELIVYEKKEKNKSKIISSWSIQYLIVKYYEQCEINMHAELESFFHDWFHA